MGANSNVTRVVQPVLDHARRLMEPECLPRSLRMILADVRDVQGWYLQGLGRNRSERRPRPPSLSGRLTASVGHQLRLLHLDFVLPDFGN